MTEQDYLFENLSKKEAGDGDDGGDGGRIFREHPSPILQAPRDNISHKRKIRHSDMGWTYVNFGPDRNIAETTRKLFKVCINDWT